MSLGGSATVPDGALLEYFVLHTEEPGEYFGAGTVEVFDDQFDASHEIADWPAGELGDDHRRSPAAGRLIRTGPPDPAPPLGVLPRRHPTVATIPAPSASLMHTERVWRST